MGKFIIQQRSMHNAVYAVEPVAHSSSNQGMVCGIYYGDRNMISVTMVLVHVTIYRKILGVN